MPELTYPADTTEAGLRLFLGWFGAYYARSTSYDITEHAEGALDARVTVGRQWALSVSLVDTLAHEADLPFEAARAAVEERLDGAGLHLALFLPRGARLPSAEPGLSKLVQAATDALPLPDGRLEVRQPVTLHLRRTATTGSVVTVLGGLSAHWAQFTNRVPGTFQLNSGELFRLPHDETERTGLTETLVVASQQPDVDDGLAVRALDAWTATRIEGRSVVLGTPNAETDAQSAVLRRNLRGGLKRLKFPTDQTLHARALVILGAATYAEEEKLSWALRGMDPSLYAGYDLVAVVADGVVKPLLQPARQTLPWDAPLS